MIREKLHALITEALSASGVELIPELTLEHPAGLSHGDYACNAALVYAKKAGADPRAFAEALVRRMERDKPQEVERIEIAGPGFINFHLSRQFFTESVAKILNNPATFGGGAQLSGRKVIIEYTDPNPFKEFHIGHLMTNTIGESLSRIFEFSGAEVKRANYQGDVGLHVAKAVWGLKQMQLPEFDMAHVGEAYAAGALAYERDEGVRKEINEINKQLYERSSAELNILYDQGRKASLEYLEEIYSILGTSFDYYFFESETGEFGRKLVREYLEKGVFEESDGAIVFRGEKYGLHTRVFLNSEGLPTYEAKELGLAKVKYDTYSYDDSFVVSANEITEYFKVLLKAMEFVFPELAAKTHHIPHGMLRLPTGKMSSRTGDVITAESLINELKARVREKMEEGDVVERDYVSQQIAIASIKYSVLKQATGSNIIFDFDRALSLEGDSGPYLQYAQTRAHSVQQRAGEQGLVADTAAAPSEVVELERLLYRFPEVVGRACREREPHYITTYLTEVAGTFNHWYAVEKIVDDRPEAPYRLALTRAFQIVMLNGLWLLGIQAPERM